MYTMCDSMTFALRHTQISLSGILRHFRPPSHHLLLHTHDTNNETWNSFSLVDPCSIFFCFSVKPKFFTPTHVIELKGTIADLLQSPLCAANCLQPTHSSGLGAVVCKSHATHRALNVYNMCATWCKGTGQLISLTELKLHLF